MKHLALIIAIVAFCVVGALEQITESEGLCFLENEQVETTKGPSEFWKLATNHDFFSSKVFKFEFETRLWVYLEPYMPDIGFTLRVFVSLIKAIYLFFVNWFCSLTFWIMAYVLLVIVHVFCACNFILLFPLFWLLGFYLDSFLEMALFILCITVWLFRFAENLIRRSMIASAESERLGLLEREVDDFSAAATNARVVHCNNVIKMPLLSAFPYLVMAMCMLLPFGLGFPLVCVYLARSWHVIRWVEIYAAQIAPYVRPRYPGSVPGAAIPPPVGLGVEPTLVNHRHINFVSGGMLESKTKMRMQPAELSTDVLEGKRKLKKMKGSKPWIWYDETGAAKAACWIPEEMEMTPELAQNLYKYHVVNVGTDIDAADVYEALGGDNVCTPVPPTPKLVRQEKTKVLPVLEEKPLETQYNVHALMENLMHEVKSELHFYQEDSARNLENALRSFREETQNQKLENRKRKKRIVNFSLPPMESNNRPSYFDRMICFGCGERGHHVKDCKVNGPNYTKLESVIPGSPLLSVETMDKYAIEVLVNDEVYGYAFCANSFIWMPLHVYKVASSAGRMALRCGFVTVMLDPSTKITQHEASIDAMVRLDTAVALFPSLQKKMFSVPKDTVYIKALGSLSTGSCVTGDGDVLRYQASTKAGFSGSLVWSNNKVVGVHMQGDDTGNQNSGVLFGPDWVQLFFRASGVATPKAVRGPDQARNGEPVSEKVHCGEVGVKGWRPAVSIS